MLTTMSFMPHNGFRILRAWNIYHAEDKQRRSSIFAFLVSQLDMSHVLTFNWMADMFGNAGGNCCSPIWSRIEMNGSWMKLIIFSSLLCASSATLWKLQVQHYGCPRLRRQIAGTSPPPGRVRQLTAASGPEPGWHLPDR